MLRVVASLGLVVGLGFWAAAIYFGCTSSQYTADALAWIGCPIFIVSFAVLWSIYDRRHDP